jgi:hypothetical protein
MKKQSITSRGQAPRNREPGNREGDMTAIEKVRDICLAFPNTSEGAHYGEIVFKVGDKLFASAGDKRGPCKVIVMLEAAHVTSLLANDKRFKPYTYEKNCVQIKASDVKDWDDEIAPLIAESYRLNVG